jgi:glycosyltransferase involved in cell wall biosynthesis
MRLFMTADAMGGVWTYALDLARGLAGQGVSTTLAVLGPRPEKPDEARARVIPGLELVCTDLPLDWVDPAPKATAIASGRLADLAARAGADMVQLNSAALGVAAFPAPVVAVAHSCVGTWQEAVRGEPLPPDLRWRADFARRGYETADAVVAPSRAFARMTAERYDLRRPPIVVHNGRALVRASPPGLGGQPAREVFAAGRLWDEGKNFVTLDRAAARIGAPVTAAGPLAAPHGDGVRFQRLAMTGPISASEMAQRLAARPVFVSVSRYEPFGLSVLEAAQAGCALVLSDIATFRELWDGGADFVPARDEAALAVAVHALLADPERRRRQGAAARARARRYTVGAMVAGMLRVYRNLRPALVAEPARPAAAARSGATA